MIDLLGRAREIGTVQIDTGNAERFGIHYVDEAGKKKHPVILHTAIIGTIERFLYLVLDQSVQLVNKGLPGVLPYFLSPEQIRLLPVSDAYIEYAMKLEKQLTAAGIRTGVDDRQEKVSKKVREAHTDWVPYQLVIGQKETDGPDLKLYSREEQQDFVLPLAQIIKLLQNKQGCYPWRPLYFPAQLSWRPLF